MHMFCFVEKYPVTSSCFIYREGGRDGSNWSSEQEVGEGGLLVLDGDAMAFCNVDDVVKEEINKLWFEFGQSVGDVFLNWRGSSTIYGLLAFKNKPADFR